MFIVYPYLIGSFYLCFLWNIVTKNDTKFTDTRQSQNWCKPIPNICSFLMRERSQVKECWYQTQLQRWDACREDWRLKLTWSHHCIHSPLRRRFERSLIWNLVDKHTWNFRLCSYRYLETDTNPAQKYQGKVMKIKLSKCDSWRKVLRPL